MTGGGLIIFAVFSAFVSLFSLFGIFTLLILKFSRQRNLLINLVTAVVLTLSTVVLIVSSYYLKPVDIIFGLALGFILNYWFALPLIFCVLAIYSSSTWIINQRKKMGKYIWFLFGIIGMFLFPLLFFIFYAIAQGKTNLGNLSSIVIFIFNPLVVFIYLHLYFTGFLTGMLIGYFFDEGILKTIRSRLWLVLALIGAIYKGVYIGLFNRPEGSLVDPSQGFNIAFSVTLDTLLWVITGALIGWIITKFLFKKKNEKG